MEGRTIVRPDLGVCRVACSLFPPSMEGRTIVRPDHPQPATQTPPHPPSMEGRTIVRPDEGVAVLAPGPLSAFNGGPDNRPARPTTSSPIHVLSPAFNGGPDNRPARRSWHHRGCWRGGGLQWRAGQSSGQTSFDTHFANVVPLLQWRAGQSSGQTIGLAPIRGSSRDLQWRAGQSSGQTSRKPRISIVICSLQWRAGQSSGQTYQPVGDAVIDGAPSMEGRTIVRPDPSRGTATSCRSVTLQWRAGQSSGQTSSTDPTR